MVSFAKRINCTLTIIPTRVHQCPSSLDKALKLMDEWIHLHAENQRRKEDIWKQRADIIAHRDQRHEEPTVGRMLIFRNSAKRPDYSELIWFDESDFSQQYGNIVIAMPADLQPKSAVAKSDSSRTGSRENIQVEAQSWTCTSFESEIHGYPWA